MLLEKGYVIEKLEEFQNRCNEKTSSSPRLIASVVPDSAYVLKVLSEAIERSDLLTVNYLLERGCDPNSKTPNSDNSSLELAAKAKDPKATAPVLDALLRHGANIHELNARESSWTNDKKHLATVKLLIEHGADTDPTSSPWIWKALLNTAYNVGPHVKTFEYLLRVICERGVSLDVLEPQLKAVEERALGKYGWRIKKVLDRAYWQMRYPVP